MTHLSFKMLPLALASALLAALPALAAAALPPPPDFTADILPLLQKHCTDCHDADQAKGQLRLDEVRGILQGGNSGEPLFVRGQSADSLIIKRVTSENPKEHMPNKGESLAPAEVALLRAWIDAGAAMPGEAAAAASLKLTTDHWSFQPVQLPPIPRSDDPFARQAIDAFVLAKLQSKALAPSPPADRPTLLRRLTLVAHGLTPSPAQVQAFVQDPRPDAYERLVDEALASPRYGERWARHWMDIARYADTNGFETNRPRPNAWPFRDYLIAAFNDDKPYDQFIREQLAGDALGQDAATGFLVAGTYDIVKGDPTLNAMQRQDELADMVNTTGTAFMGLTMGCARCHNHKFDPILQKDYYAMQAVFAGVNHGERPIRQPQSEAAAKEGAALAAAESAQAAHLETFRQKAAAAASPSAALLPPVNAQRNEESFPALETSAVRFTIAASSAAEPGLDELEIYDASGQNVALATRGAIPTASGTLPGYPAHQLQHLNDGLTGNEHSWIASAPTGWVQIDFPAPARIQRLVWGRDRSGAFQDRLAIRYQIEARGPSGSWIPLANSEARAPFAGPADPAAFLAKLSPADAAAARAALQDLAATRSRLAALRGSQNAWIGTFTQPDKTYRLYRGELLQKREVVAPDALTVLGSLGLAVDEPEQQRRLQLARWIASPQNPLTARVLVNRLWHYIFGHGIVDTPGDFGVNGARPTHPELLDWLAHEFVQSGWSIKHIQKLILLSQTFQQTSTPRAAAQEIDADGRFLWRYTPRRLEAEAIRDSILSVAGTLDPHMGGPGFFLQEVVEENVMHYFPKEKYTPAEFRRMVYLFRIRQATDSVFGSFDCPDGGQIMSKRSRSNTPLQALNLFNSTFVLQQADLLSARLRREAGDSPEAQTALAFALCSARPPDAWELAESAAMIRAQGLPSFCRALFNSSEFLFLF